MDTYSAPQVAAAAGISLPRVHRLLDRHGVPPAAGPGKARQVPAAVAEAIEREIGKVPRRRSGLTREAVLAAKAVAHAPLGIRSARALARLTGTSPTTAAKALHELQARGLVTQRTRTVASGRAVEVTEWVARSLATWPRSLLGDAKAAALPQPPQRDRATKVPARFHHLFWNVDVRALTLPADAAFVASRLLAAPDPTATAWAVTGLPYEALEKAMSSRSFAPRDRWLLNVARAS
ncbi:MarR family transcriptional regulator [Cellulomonas endometrii]|uniref:MarR family transcriptional regulator n=1 Tax=Cellulomonas endometrii TaxID=3036301 RepID=UPI0024AE8245|nr:helix-turn-helix domain-containing protein [Cellulomonas endometrii]